MVPGYLQGSLSSNLYLFSTGSREETFFKLYDEEHYDQFTIFFDGVYEQGMIRWKEDLPPRITARSLKTGKEFVLFDGMIHGYDAYIAGFYIGRKRESLQMLPYKDLAGNSVFEVFLNFDYDHGEDELEEDFYEELRNLHEQWYLDNGFESGVDMASCAFVSVTIGLGIKDQPLQVILEEETA